MTKDDWRDATIGRVVRRMNGMDVKTDKDSGTETPVARMSKLFNIEVLGE